MAGLKLSCVMRCSTECSSASLDDTSANTRSEMDDADVSSAPLRGAARRMEEGRLSLRAVSSGAGSQPITTVTHFSGAVAAH